MSGNDAKVGLVTEEMLKRTTPVGRLPGQWLRRHLVVSNKTFDKLWPKIYEEMAEYKVVGFDVECVNFKNSATFAKFFDKRAENDSHVLNDAMSILPTTSGQNFCRTSLEYEKSRPIFDVSASPNFFGRRPKMTLPLHFANEKRTRKEISVLIQLATWTGNTFLIRLCYLDHIPEALQIFLADRTVIKLGVGIEVDAFRLWSDWGICVRGWIDLRNPCIRLSLQRPDFRFEKLSLKSLGLTLFGDQRFKQSAMRKISFSDWTLPRLTPHQLYYASWDAQIAVDIFSFVSQMLCSMPEPDINSVSYYAELFEKCQEFVEMPRFDEDPPGARNRTAVDDGDDGCCYDDEDFLWSPECADETNLEIDEKLRKFSIVMPGDIDSFFENEQTKSNKLLEQTRNDIDSFDPLGFHAHVRSKRFDRRLFERLKLQYGEASLEKYMEERQRQKVTDDERAAFEVVRTATRAAALANANVERRHLCTPPPMSLRGYAADGRRSDNKTAVVDGGAFFEQHYAEGSSSSRLRSYHGNPPFVAGYSRRWLNLRNSPASHYPHYGESPSSCGYQRARRSRGSVRGDYFESASQSPTQQSNFCSTPIRKNYNGYARSNFVSAARPYRRSAISPEQSSSHLCSSYLPPERNAVRYENVDYAGVADAYEDDASGGAIDAPMPRASVADTGRGVRSFWRSELRRAARFSGWQFYRGTLPPRFATAQSLQEQEDHWE